MSSITPTLDLFDPATAPTPELEAMHTFTSALRAELLADDPPTPFAEACAVWRMAATAGQVNTWMVREPDDGPVVARGQVAYPRTRENLTVVNGSVEVLAGHRGRGLARLLVARITEVMRRENRPVLLATTMANAPGGTALMERVGARRGLETSVLQLRMDALDREHVRAAAATAAAADFELGYWDGPYPDVELEAIAGLIAVMATQPTGTLTVEHDPCTPARLREVEQAMSARAMLRWTAYACERSSGRLAGFTEVTWQPRRPELLLQGNTGVLPAFRGRGLGCRLKNAMLDRVLHERPEVRFIRTTTADINGPMRAINHSLGFTPYSARTVWQADLGGIETWLRAGATS